jgi:hypothetical protein
MNILEGMITLFFAAEAYADMVAKVAATEAERDAALAREAAANVEADKCRYKGELYYELFVQATERQATR